MRGHGVPIMAGGGNAVAVGVLAGVGSATTTAWGDDDGAAWGNGDASAWETAAQWPRAESYICGSVLRGNPWRSLGKEEKKRGYKGAVREDAVT
jgi:hypothetical protein